MPRQCEIVVLVTAILGVLLFVFPVCAQSRAPDSPTADHAIALEVGKPVEREIRGGATHRYSIRLEAGQLLDATVEQKSVDVAVALLDPAGKTVLEVDSPNGTNGPEPVLFVSEAGGTFTLEVKTLDPADNGGRYEARVNEIRVATEKDRQLGEASRLFGQSVLLSSTGKYREAIPLAERAVALYEQALGPDHPDVATSLNNLAELHRNQGAYAKAEPLFVRSLAIREKALGPEHRDVATSLNNLAGLHYSQGAYSKAEPLFVRALAIFEKALGPDHSAVATSLNNLAALYRDQGAYAKAEPLYARALAIREKALGPDHLDVANSMNNLTALYRDQGAYAKAEPLYVRALAIREKALGPDHALVVQSLNDLAEFYRNQGAYMKAEPLYARSLAIIEKALGPDHPDVAKALNALARLYQAQGAYAKAELLYEQSLAIREKALGPDHPLVATSLNNLSLLYQDQGAYAKAEPLSARSLAIWEKALGPDHSLVATALNNLAELYRNQGVYAKAKPLYVRSLAIFEKALGPDHLDVAQSMNNLAMLYQAQGAYAKGELLNARALAIREKSRGPDHPDVAQSLNNLAFLYYNQGAYAKAEPLYARSLAIWEKMLGPDHPLVAQSLNNLAVLYMAQGAYAKAEPMYARSLSIREKALGPDHPDVAQSLNNLALLYYYQGAYVKAEPLYARSLAIWEKALGPDHPFVAQSLNNLAALYKDQGAYAKAEQMYLCSLAIREKALGPAHPAVATSLNHQAVFYLATGSVDRAVENQARGNDARERELSVNLASGSERSKLQYLQLTAAELDRTVSLHVQCAPKNPEAHRLALEIILRRKGRGLDVMTDQIAAVRRLASPEDLAVLDELAQARSELSRRTLAGAGKAGVVAHRASLDELDRRVEALEGQIAERSSRFRAVSQRVTLDAVGKAIPSGTSLVEFAVYRPFHPKAAAGKQFGSPRYVVYLVGPEGEPRWADLGEAAAIDAAVGKLREALRDPKRRDVNSLARELDEMVMRPVRRLAGSTRHLLLAPDGALNLVPFAALVDERGRYVVESYELTYLTSGRDLLRLAESSPPREMALVVADPDYGDASLALSADTRAIVQKQAEAGTVSVDFGEIGFPPLANTEAEAREVGVLLPGFRVLTGGAATEAALKSAHAPEVLHVATHGYFLPDLEIRPASGSGDRGFGSTDLAQAFAGVKIENPLLRSGLAMAGANARRSGEDNGVLTASEVAGLDLWGTKLVVLSACQTGVGEVKAGDGVYGLRRALLLAGSESQMMSLWRVADRETRELMRAFYTRLRAGAGRTAALRQVQLAMLRNPRTRHPFYWAAFIQSGAWGPLGEVHGSRH